MTMTTRPALPHFRRTRRETVRRPPYVRTGVPACRDCSPLLVSYDLAGGEKDYVFGDIDGVIGYPFEVLGDG